MKIERNKVVAFHYTLRQVGGESLEQSDPARPELYLHGHNNILLAMERAFEGREAGDSFTIELAPKDAYGEIKPERKVRVSLKHIVQPKQSLRAGARVQVQTKEGTIDARVIKVGKFNIDVDTNHPLAGMSLSFDIEIADVRDATDEELAHRHAHGVGGHEH